jgi:hypothetical protein
VVCLGLGAGCSGEQPGQEEVGVASAALLSSADCPAGYNVIQGTSAANVINGTSGNDCILGHGGNDVINGVAGNDFLVGGAGDDEIYGSTGHDVVHGEDGNDDLNGEAGNDTLHGGIGSDYLSGNGDNDILNGGDASDQCWGGPGHDVIAGGAGNDTLRGEDGNDFIADSGSNNVNGGAGTDRCTGTSCEQAAPVVSGCTQSNQCAVSQTCVADVGVCLPCGTVGGVGCSTGDNCPSDPNKTEPGICGCGVADTDSDADGTANCNDACASDPNKIVAGMCGCGVADTDSDADGTANCNDGCPSDAAKIAAGACGCGVAETDADGDSVIDCIDICLGFDDAQDADQDGIPDGCDTNCPPGAITHAGDVNVNVGQSLEAYQGVTCIMGDLIIELSDLTSLAGLESLDTVTGDVRIQSNASLTSLAALDNLAMIHGTLRIDNNPMLPGCWPSAIAAQTGIACGDGLAPCENNTGSGSCGALPPGFVCEPGASGPGVYDGELYVSGPDALDALDELGGVTCVTGSIGIFDTDLTDLAPFSSLAMIGGGLFIVDNDALEGVDGLESLISVGDSVSISRNNALQDLAGLASLSEMGPVNEPPYTTTFDIADNASLPACWSWRIADQLGTVCGPLGAPFENCGGNAGAGSCGELPPGFVCEPGASGPGVFQGSLGLYGQGAGDFASELGGITCVTHDVTIDHTDLVDLSVLSSLTAIGGGLYIVDNDALDSVDGLEALARVGGSVLISRNEQLHGLAGLASLSEMGPVNLPPYTTTFNITDNESLPACWSWLIADQLDTDCGPVGYPFYSCGGNTGTGSCGELPPGFVCEPGASGPGVFQGPLDLYGTEHADELGGIACVTDYLTLYGTDLVDLSMFSSLTAIGGALYIVDNDALESVDGLESLTSAGALHVDGNDALRDLMGLTGLETIGAVAGPNSTPIIIANNTSMPECWAELIATQVGTTCEPSPGLSNDCSGNGGGSCRLTTSFETIAELDGFDSRLTAVDADGSTVVGVRSSNMIEEGFRYDASVGVVILDSAHPSASRSVPVDVTADGQTVIGYSWWSTLGVNYRAALWDALGDVTHSGPSSNAIPTWIAPDGGGALGFIPGAYESPQAYDSAMTVTASIAASSTYSIHQPVAASDDGSVILVNRRLSNGAWESVIYNSPTFGFPNVIPHRAGSSSQYFADMAPDASAVVGHTVDFNGNVAVAWTWSAGYMTIPGLGACVDSDAVAVAQRAAGLRVVGHCDGQAYVWDENGTTRTLGEALTDLGITPPADAFLHVEDISADGTTLVGYTIDYFDENERHAWIVRLGEDYAVLP